MITEEELAKKYLEWRKLNAKILMLKDVCDLLDKYEKKINRLSNETTNNFERLQKNNPNSKAPLEALKNQNMLRNKDNAVMDLRIELMKRSITLLEQESEMGKEVDTMMKEFEENS